MWVPVVGYEGLYEVSDEGEVRSAKTGRLKALDLKEYPVLHLFRNGKRTHLNLHTVVATAFHGPCPQGLECRHLNGDSRDHRASNLCWGTPGENKRDSVAHRTHVSTRKTHCPQNHLYDEKNTRIYRGRRYCKACQRARNRRS
jgi:hypothetical protein